MSRPGWSPLPASLAPMLALPGSPPAGRLAEWAVEMKWDGVRALAFVEGGRLRLVSRTGKDISATYPDLAGLGPAVTAAAGGRRCSTARSSPSPTGAPTSRRCSRGCTCRRPTPPSASRP